MTAWNLVHHIAEEVELWTTIAVNLFVIIGFLAWICDPAGQPDLRRIRATIVLAAKLAGIMFILAFDLFFIVLSQGPPDQLWMRWVAGVLVGMGTVALATRETMKFLSVTK